MAVRCADCTRRQHLKREASETRFAQTADASLSDFGTGDVSPSTGIHGNGSDNDNDGVIRQMKRKYPPTPHERIELREKQREVETRSR